MTPMTSKFAPTGQARIPRDRGARRTGRAAWVRGAWLRGIQVVGALGLCGELFIGCANPSADAMNAAATAAPVAAPTVAEDQAKPVPIAQILAKVEDEVEAMRRLLGLGAITGKVLGESNSKLQHRSYFRRIPANPTLEALRATLRQSAESAGLVVLDLRCELPNDQSADKAAAAPAVLKTSERWTVDEDRLLGTIDVTVDLEGSVDTIAGWINGLPGSTERLYWVRQAQRLGDRAVRLRGQAFFERPQEQRRVEVTWPSLDDWLRSAGHDPASPMVQGYPSYEQLVAMVQLGRQIVPDVRSVLVSTNDLPRWAARGRIFDRCSRQIAAVDGQSLLAPIDQHPNAAP